MVGAHQILSLDSIVEIRVQQLLGGLISFRISISGGILPPLLLKVKT